MARQARLGWRDSNSLAKPVYTPHLLRLTLFHGASYGVRFLFAPMGVPPPPMPRIPAQLTPEQCAWRHNVAEARRELAAFLAGREYHYQPFDPKDPRGYGPCTIRK